MINKEVEIAEVKYELNVAYISEHTLTWIQDGLVCFMECTDNKSARKCAEKLITYGIVEYARDNGRLCWFEGHDPSDPYAMLSTW